MTDKIITASECSKLGMFYIESKKVRNHKLGNSARVHTGEAEKEEYRLYRDSLTTRQACLAYELKGCDHYE